jgi:hypothetical protein
MLRIFCPRREEETKGWRKLNNNFPRDLFSSENKAHQTKKDRGIILFVIL